MYSLLIPSQFFDFRRDGLRPVRLFQHCYLVDKPRVTLRLISGWHASAHLLGLWRITPQEARG